MTDYKDEIQGDDFKNNGLRFKGIYTRQVTTGSSGWMISPTTILATEVYQLTVCSLTLDAVGTWQINHTSSTAYPLIRATAANTPLEYPNDIWVTYGNGLYLLEVAGAVNASYTISGIIWTIL